MTETETQIQSEIIRIISETLQIPASEMQLETSIRALPNVESIRILNVILKVEKRFDIEIPDAATFRVETIGEFIELVRSQLSTKPQPSAATA
ncbi:MAG: hypothetical protein NVSMB62_21580 [Acidobacteriaceae bacterium]